MSRAAEGSLEGAREMLAGFADKDRARNLQRFFKTGPGEYGEGDLFLGVRVPDVRRTAKKYPALAMEDVKRLLRSPVHEERLLALLIMVGRYGRGDGAERNRIYRLYQEMILVHMQAVSLHTLKGDSRTQDFAQSVVVVGSQVQVILDLRPEIFAPRFGTE